jgi:hypothetical protein
MATRGHLKSVEFKQAELTSISASDVVETSVTAPALGNSVTVLKPAGTAFHGDLNGKERVSGRRRSDQGLAGGASLHSGGNNSSPRPGVGRIVQRNGCPDEIAARVSLSSDR